jgi:hypothetical protein
MELSLGDNLRKARSQHFIVSLGSCRTCFSDAFTGRHSLSEVPGEEQKLADFNGKRFQALDAREWARKL